MKKSLIIKGIPFKYDAEELSWAINRPMREDSATKLMNKVDCLFKKIELPYYLSFGTLLGAIREKGLIKGDEDIDVFIDNQNLLYNNLPFLQENGLFLIRYVKDSVFSFKVDDGSYIDVYVLCDLPWYNIWASYCYSLDGYVTPKKYFKGYEEISFLGIQCKCPKNPTSILEFWYGKTWRIPVSGHKFYYEVKTAYYWHWLRDNFIKKVLFYDHWCKYLKR